jgi:hypothetical protein
MERGVHRLALVSKLLLDREVIQLRAENERLRLELFWRDHNAKELSNAMASANQSTRGPQCTCYVCALTKRRAPDYEMESSDDEPAPESSDDEDPMVVSVDEGGPGGGGEGRDGGWDARCKFKPWFEACIDFHGLVALVGTPPDQEGEIHDSGGEYVVYDVDSHFHHQINRDWYKWTYGSRLWKATNVDDPELGKLRALFAALEHICEDEDEDEDEDE